MDGPLFREEKSRGKTVLMSSRIFSELEKTCGRAAMIKDGRIIMEESIEAIRARQKQKLLATADGPEALKALAESPYATGAA
ncbi:hypothetical protein FE781_09710 [Paenibacillus thermoaerophilus]|nr:hypothetical protein [Paenibacillus thermoaerophilus]TMV15859.1 hypothetical protein FE781_09710 [Paenibacillus thermoaerophilus]